MKAHDQNGIVIEQDNPGQITPVPHDQDQSTLPPPINSEDDHGGSDSSEEKTALYPLKEKRKKFKVRSISDCVNNDEVGSTFQRGILKKVSNGRLRSLSESCADNYSISNNGESLSALDEWFEEDEDGEDDGENQKMKKTVRFSDTVHKQLFRSTASILGQRRKNQRKKKKAAGNKASSEHSLSSSTESESAAFVADVCDGLENVVLSDSGIEVGSDSDPCVETSSSPPQQQPATNGNQKAKKNKKRKGKANRQRRASESSCSEMIFDIDL